MKNISGDDEAFDMEELRINLPKKKSRRGLSRYYAEKARSFACVLDVKCLEDLKKPTHEPLDDDDDDDDDANKKRRRKKNRQSSSSWFSAVLNNNNNNVNFQKYPCRRVSSSIHFSSPCVGV